MMTGGIGLRSRQRGIWSAALLVSSTLAAGSLLAPPAHAQGAQGEVFDISAQPLPAALIAFGRQSGLQVSVPAGLAEGRRASAVSGTMAAPDALSRLLAGTGLTFRISGNTVTLTPAPQAGGDAVQLGAVRVGARGGGDDRSTTIAVTTSDPAATEGTGSYTTHQMSSATGLPLSIRDTPQSVSVVTRQEIEDYDLETMTDALARTPGITVSNWGSERAVVYARGFSPPTYKIDGMQMWYSSTYNDTMTLTDMTIFDRVEVVRGASGLMDGAGEPAGTINMIRKRPTREQHGSVFGTVGSWNDYRGGADISSPLNASGTIRGRVVGSYKDAESYLDRYKIRKAIVYGVLEFDVSEDTMVTVGWDYQHNRVYAASRNGLPLLYDDGTQIDYDRSTNSGGGGLPANRSFENKFIRIDHDFGNAWHMQAMYNRTAAKRGGYIANAYYGAPDSDGYGVYVSGSYYQGTTEQDSYLLTLNGPITFLGGQHDLAFGFNGMVANDDHHYYGSIYTQLEDSIFDWDGEVEGMADLKDTGIRGGYPREIQEFGGYGSGRFNVADGLSLILGSRLVWMNYDYTYYNVASPSSDYTRHYESNGHWIPYAALTYRLNDNWSVYGSYTNIFKRQEYRDRNNEPIDPTTGTNYEIGVKASYFEDRLNFAVALFRIEQDNLATKDSDYTETLPDGSSAYMTIDGAVTQGIDVELSGEVLPGWQLSANYSYTNQEDKDGERITTETPEHIGRFNTTYKLPDTGLTLGGNLTWQSRVFKVFTGWPYTGTVNQDGYVLAGIFGKYDFTRNLSASVNVDNLFDKKYLSNIDSTFATGLYGAPRNFTATVRYRF